MTEFLSPRPLRPSDRLTDFSCGEEAIDRWLRGRARNNDRSGASRTMVSTTREGQVAGFYCLSSNALIRESAPDALSKGQPDPVPVILLGRMGVDLQFRGSGLGWSLLQHATSRALEAAEIIGVHAILVDALSDGVIPFYERFGFTRFPGSSRALYLLTKDAAATLAAS